MVKKNRGTGPAEHLRHVSSIPASGEKRGLITKSNPLKELEDRLAAVGLSVELEHLVKHGKHRPCIDVFGLGGLGEKVDAIFVDWLRIWAETEVSYRLS